MWPAVGIRGRTPHNILVFSPSVGVKHFWVDLDEMHVFVPTPNVGVVHM